MRDAEGSEAPTTGIDKLLALMGSEVVEFDRIICVSVAGGAMAAAAAVVAAAAEPSVEGDPPPVSVAASGADATAVVPKVPGEYYLQKHLVLDPDSDSGSPAAL
jgi:hypothetical protein